MKSSPKKQYKEIKPKKSNTKENKPKKSNIIGRSMAPDEPVSCTLFEYCAVSAGATGSVVQLYQDTSLGLCFTLPSCIHNNFTMSSYFSSLYNNCKTQCFETNPQFAYIHVFCMCFPLYSLSRSLPLSFLFYIYVFLSIELFYLSDFALCRISVSLSLPPFAKLTIPNTNVY